MSTELKNTDFVKFLNYSILQKYPALAHHLNMKYGVAPSKNIGELNHQQLDRLCQLLDRDSQVSLEMLLAEQLKVFSDLQPDRATLEDISSELGGLEVIDDDQD